MDIKVTGPKGTQETKKTKKTNKAGPAAGPSFASMLDPASETQETTAPSSVTGVSGIRSNPLPLEGQEEIPQEPGEHGAYLLQQLEELEKDILSGSPTQAVERLKQALENSPLDQATLTEKQREILDELHLRAAVEVAKIESE